MWLGLGLRERSRLAVWVRWDMSHQRGPVVKFLLGKSVSLGSLLILAAPVWLVVVPVTGRRMQCVSCLALGLVRLRLEGL